MTNADYEFEKLENALVRAGREVDFPATPPLAARVREEILRAPARRQEMRRTGRLRLWLSLAAAMLVALALLFALPGAREAVAQFLGLRGLRIFYVSPTPTVTPTAAPGLAATILAGVPTTPAPRVTATPRPSTTPTIRSAALCCETSFADAQKRARFKLLVPPGPPPDRVYYQNVYDNGEQVVMVFGDPASPRFTLYQAQRWIYGKLVSGQAQTIIQETAVNGNRALWLAGAPHLLMHLDANRQPVYETQRTVDANTLVWETGNDYDGIIYRLETKGSLNDAVRFAEALTEAK